MQRTREGIHTPFQEVFDGNDALYIPQYLRDLAANDRPDQAFYIPEYLRTLAAEAEKEASSPVIVPEYLKTFVEDDGVEPSLFVPEYLSTFKDDQVILDTEVHIPHYLRTIADKGIQYTLEVLHEENHLPTPQSANDTVDAGVIELGTGRDECERRIQVVVRKRARGEHGRHNKRRIVCLLGAMGIAAATLLSQLPQLPHKNSTQAISIAAAHKPIPNVKASIISLPVIESATAKDTASPQPIYSTLSASTGSSATQNNTAPAATEAAPVATTPPEVKKKVEAPLNEAQFKALRAKNKTMNKLMQKYANTSGNLSIEEFDYLDKNKWGNHRLNKEAAQAFRQLAAAFEKAFGRKLEITDSYRSLAEQKSLMGRKPGLAAAAGTSIHGWGGAVDFASNIDGYDTPEHKWMVENGPTYGWRNPYWAQRGSKRQEPWHFEHDSDPDAPVEPPVAVVPSVEQPPAPVIPPAAEPITEPALPATPVLAPPTPAPEVPAAPLTEVPD